VKGREGASQHHPLPPLLTVLISPVASLVDGSKKLKELDNQPERLLKLHLKGESIEKKAQ